MSQRIALITGIGGQDGSYLVELLLKKNYKVYGTIRRASNLNTERIEHILHKLTLFYTDVTDTSSIASILSRIEHANRSLERLEIYNLAAQSHVQVSFDMPLYTTQTNLVGVLNILEAIKNSSIKDKIRIYQASTSEMFGAVLEVPQNEKTPFNPQSPYGTAKLAAHYFVKNYRESYGLFAVSGILFNHESPRRAFNFVTRKITLGLSKILKGSTDILTLGNLDAYRDWGHSRDFVRGMWLMLQQNEKPEDFVLSTNRMYSVRDFVEIAFALRGFDIKWKYSGIDEIGFDCKTGRKLICVDEKYYRPNEVEQLLGDSKKARTKLKWKPEISFNELVREMVEHDCQ